MFKLRQMSEEEESGGTEGGWIKSAGLEAVSMESGTAGMSEAGAEGGEVTEIFCGAREGGDALGGAGNPGDRGIVAREGPASRSRSTAMGSSGEGKRQVIPENLIQTRTKPWIRREMTTAATQGER
ncbi:MAG: hypothetical protein WJ289_13360 [Ferrovum myxofaciens]|uniref:hypothetical protein n=1 Tax=Ferrovum myxofaciens TaxID=416213 RepID=UPI001AF62E12|nr:hypothetical protein [Ferrovum myxofaciens]QKE38693.1 MAG: hypothetical protein HO273_08085 [Ferrovum myxofaciens]QWY73895.1 MAG: hypothetical protein JVY19_08605 [Ferrovum myxofaciens]